jgi:hypothetical protein
MRQIITITEARELLERNPSLSYVDISVKQGSEAEHYIFVEIGDG